MHLQDWSIRVLQSPLFQQIAPLIVLFLIPAIFVLSAIQIRRLELDRFVYGIYKSMGLDSLGFSVPWLFGGSSSQVAVSSSTGSHSQRQKRKSSATSSGSKGRNVRTRAEQIAMANVAKQSKTTQIHEDSEYDDANYYPGLVNISGTYCFMNSTLQALASLTYLQPQIDAIHAKAEALDVPTPVIDALQELFSNLNTPKSSYSALRPHGIINALSSPPPPPLSSNSPNSFHPSSSSSLFTSREHQDAQELFQLVSECIKNEMTAVDREGLRDRGIAGVLEISKALSRPGKQQEDFPNDLEPRNLSSKSVFDGLTANRRSCVMCGYTEAVMHFGFDNWQLAVPRLAASCRLEDCLEDYTRLEILKDCICRKCSILSTHKRLLAELKTLEEALAPASSSTSASTSSTPFSPSSPAASSSAMPSASPQKSKPSQSKKKRYKEVKRMEQRVKTALAEGRIEDESLLEGVRLEKVVSPASTKQAMIARPPPVLALHLNRSVHYGQYASKNNIRVYFPEVLDLTPFTTSGSLSTVPTSSISTPSPLPSGNMSDITTPSASDSAADSEHPPRRSTTPTQETYTPGTQRTIYRLAAVVCHYGQHSFGHYICYRRKPKKQHGKWVPPTLLDPLRVEEEEIDAGADGDVETDVDNGPVNGKSSHKAAQNGTARPRSGVDYFGSTTYATASTYYWEDHTEADAGLNRGWLRISDDSVEECGIERVLAEGNGAFMLYYERALQPRLGVYLRGRRAGASGKATPRGQSQRGTLSVANGRSRSRSRSRNGRTSEDSGAETDADAFSIGSEETLKPETKIVDLNGSVGSLISEVGVGIMKVHKKEKAKADKEREKEKAVIRKESISMSMHLPGAHSSLQPLALKGFGPRIIRNVSAGRRRMLNGNGDGHGLETLSSSSSDVSSPSPESQPRLNGSALHNHDGDEDKVPPEMIASAPSILDTAKSRLNGSTSTTHSHAGLGSKSTKVMHHPPPSTLGSKVKTR